MSHNEVFIEFQQDMLFLLIFIGVELLVEISKFDNPVIVLPIVLILNPINNGL